METESEAPAEAGASSGSEDPTASVAADEGQTEGSEATVEHDILDLDAFGTHHIQLGDGESVSVAELRDSGLRQADYTRKTQELAAERARNEQGAALLEAYERNPEGTLAYLAQQQGQTLSGGNNTPAAQTADDDWLTDPTPSSEAPASDSLEARVARMEGRDAEAAATAAIQTAFDGLKAKYGDDVDTTAVAQHAMKLGIQRPEQLDMVYRDLHFDTVRGRADALDSTEAAKVAEDAKRSQAAADAAAATGAGAGARLGSTTTPTAPSRPMTIREAAELAEQQLAARAS